MSIQLANNAETLLAVDISASATSMTVEDASSFPTLGSGDYFYCTLRRVSGSHEIVKVTGIAGNVFSITRGQEGTAALSFASGSRVELRLTVQSLEDSIEKYLTTTGTIGSPIVLVVSGQSNVTVAPTYSWTPEINVQEWNWDTDPTHVGTAFTTLTGTTMKLGHAFANKIAKNNPSRDVYLINIGRGATPIANWLPSGSPDMYAAVKNNVEAALAAIGVDKIDALLWWQGENDSATPSNYVSDFDSLHDLWRAETWFPYETPVIIMGISELTSDADLTAFNRYLVACTHDSSRVYVHTPNLPVQFWDPDIFAYIHMNAEGYEAAGNMAADAYLSGTRDRASDQLYEPSFYKSLTVTQADGGASDTAVLNIVSDAGTLALKQFSTTNGLVPSAASLTNPGNLIISPTGALTLQSNGNVGISIATSGVPTLTTPVLGVATGTSLALTGALTAGASSSVTKTQNTSTSLTVSNTDTGTSAAAELLAVSSAGTLGIRQYSALHSTFPNTAVFSTPSNLLLAPTGTLVMGANGNVGISIATSGVPTLTTPVLGTPTSGTLTNCTGLPVSTGVSGLGSGVATFLATPSSANLRSALTDETGTGAAVFGTSPTITTPNIVGTTAVGNANVGSVGEELTATLAAGSATSLTTNTAKTITSISLTAGDWIVSAHGYFVPATTTVITTGYTSISQTNNTLDQTPGAWGVWNGSVTSAGLTTISSNTAGYRINVSSTTTIYLVGQAGFTTSTCTAYGKISARRVR